MRYSLVNRVYIYYPLTRSQLSSTDLVSEYQTKVARQKSFFEEQIKLLATRMQMETAKPRDFHQLSPLTETTEPEFGEVGLAGSICKYTLGTKFLSLTGPGKWRIYTFDPQLTI